MREIKFRFLFEKSGEKKYIYRSVLEISSFNAMYSTGWKLLAIEQYTGLKDQNGKEIYEGDVVEMNIAESIIETATVSWCDMQFRFKMNGYGFDKTMVCKIIGNIHDEENT